MLNLISLRKLSLKIAMKILISIKVLVIGCIDLSWILNSLKKKAKNWWVNLNLKAVWLLAKLWVVVASVGRRVLMMDLFKKALFLLMLNFLLTYHLLFMLGDLMIIIKWVIYLQLEILGKFFMVSITIILLCSQESWFQDKFNFRLNVCLQFSKFFVHKLILY